MNYNVTNVANIDSKLVISLQKISKFILKLLIIL